MKIGRIVQLVIIGIAIVYVGILQNANPTPLALPGLVPLPLWIVLSFTALVAFLAGWVPTAVRGWRHGREARRLERRVAELESHVPSYDRRGSAPVIPDRVDEEKAGQANGGSDTAPSPGSRPNR